MPSQDTTESDRLVAEHDLLEQVEWAIGTLLHPAKQLWHSPEYAEERAADEDAHQYNERECEGVQRLVRNRMREVGAKLKKLNPQRPGGTPESIADPRVGLACRLRLTADTGTSLTISGSDRLPLPELWLRRLLHEAADALERSGAEPSPDLKEAISAALRSYRCRHSVYHDGEGKALAVLLSGEGKSVATGEEELDLLTDHLAGATMPALSPALTSEEAEAILGCAEAASAWAPSRTADAGEHLVGQARIARAAAERLSGAGAPTSFRIDRRQVETGADSLTGAEIRRSQGIAPDRDLFEVVGGRPDRKIEDDDTVAVHSGLRLYTVPRIIGAGAAESDGEIGLHRDQIGDIKDLGLMLDRLEGRVQALELHRAGLTDGQAEAALARPSDAQLRVIYHEVTGDPLEDGLEAPALAAMRSVLAAPDVAAGGQRLIDAGWAPTHPGRPGLLHGYAKKIREMASHV